MDLTDAGILFPSGETLSWRDAERIVKAENACFVERDGHWLKAQAFSEVTNRASSLYPTRGAPTMLLAGFPMHRVKESDPYAAARAMVKSIAPVTGRVLDTATGLGYAAIEMARTAEHILTVELDPAAQEIAALNPWSRELFGNPRIEQRIGDSLEIVPTLPDNAFARVLHDPPTMSLAGELYSEEFYRELWRVLQRGGKLFHYVGDPTSKLGGNLTRGVAQRLVRAGFAHVTRRAEAFGLTAVKTGNY